MSLKLSNDVISIIVKYYHRFRNTAIQQHLRKKTAWIRDFLSDWQFETLDHANALFFNYPIIYEFSWCNLRKWPVAGWLFENHYNASTYLQTALDISNDYYRKYQ